MTIYRIKRKVEESTSAYGRGLTGGKVRVVRWQILAYVADILDAEMFQRVYQIKHPHAVLASDTMNVVGEKTIEEPIQAGQDEPAVH